MPRTPRGVQLAESEPAAPKKTARESSPFLRSMEVFLSVLEHESFSGAAKALQLSQPTVSQRIQGLEDSLGLELFNRGSGQVQPTNAGRILRLYAERLLQVRDEMVAELQGLVELTHGTLRVGASSTVGNYVMPTLLQRFKERYSGLRIVMEISDSEKVIELVRDGAVELGVVGSAVADAEFHVEPFIEDEIVVVAPPGHPAIAREQISPEELAEFSWIVREPGSGTRRSIEERLARTLLGKKIRVAMVLDDNEAIKRAVRAGAGISLMSIRAVDNEVALGLLGVARVAGPGLSRSFYLVRPQQRTLSPAAMAMWNHLLGAERVRQVG